MKTKVVDLKTKTVSKHKRLRPKIKDRSGKTLYPGPAETITYHTGNDNGYRVVKGKV